GGHVKNWDGGGVVFLFNQGPELLHMPRKETYSKDGPPARCFPHGAPAAMLVPATPFKFIQTPIVTLILFENQGRYRQVFTDGRGLPKEMRRTRVGYSIGRWDE